VDPVWVLAAIAFELASCASFVVLYGLFFDRIAPAPARALAWTSMAGGALLPAGGAGGLAIAGWLVHAMGHETGWILRRSSALFVLTSALNVVTVIAAGCLALAGADGPGRPPARGAAGPPGLRADRPRRGVRAPLGPGAARGRRRHPPGRAARRRR
jgi:hypothetical protein